MCVFDFCFSHLSRRNSHDSLNDVSDDDWEEVAERLPPPPDNPNQGLPVRALYDYTAEVGEERKEKEKTRERKGERKEREKEKEREKKERKRGLKLAHTLKIVSSSPSSFPFLSFDFVGTRGD